MRAIGHSGTICTILQENGTFQFAPILPLSRTSVDG